VQSKKCPLPALGNAVLRRPRSAAPSPCVFTTSENNSLFATDALAVNGAHSSVKAKSATGSDGVTHAVEKWLNVLMEGLTRAL